MNKIIVCLLSLTTAIAALLLSIAALLICAPELLVGILRIGIAVFCVIAGLCMLTPLLLLVIPSAVAAWNKEIKHRQEKKAPCLNENT